LLLERVYQRGQFGLTLDTFSGAFLRFKGLNMPFEGLYARRVFGRNLSGARSANSAACLSARTSTLLSWSLERLDVGFEGPYQCCVFEPAYGPLASVRAADSLLRVNVG
jgi:hypothetical protein